MSLRKQLNEILTQLLPSDPGQAIKGTELIRLARRNIGEDYSDASLRYHFSIMSCDPTSPIAKVEKGQGYYRRGEQLPALSGAQEIFALRQGQLDDLEDGGPRSGDQVVLRARKFRAVLGRYFEANGRFPFIFREVFSQESPMGNFWKYPELLLIDFDANGEELLFDHEELLFKQHLGIPPFRIHGVRLRVQASLATYREDFFQTLSACSWAHGGELIYARAIEDEALADGLRKLSNQYGIGVTSFGLSESILDELPRPAHIKSAQGRETEAILSKLEVNRIGNGQLRDQIDWPELKALRAKSEEVRKLLVWLQECLKKGRAQAFDG